VRSLMAFVCQEIKGLLTYLLTYIATMLHVAQKLYRDRSKVTSDQSGQESRSGPVWTLMSTNLMTSWLMLIKQIVCWQWNHLWISVTFDERSIGVSLILLTYQW